MAFVNNKPKPDDHDEYDVPDLEKVDFLKADSADWFRLNRALEMVDWSDIFAVENVES